MELILKHLNSKINFQIIKIAFYHYLENLISAAILSFNNLFTIRFILVSDINVFSNNLISLNMGLTKKGPCAPNVCHNKYFHS